jgi:CHAT domain-containing protein/WD40 repeat protein
MHQSRMLLGHRDSVYTIVFSLDGKRIASGSRDGTAVVWQSETGEIEQRISIGGHIVDLAFSSDGTLLAAGNTDGTVIVCDAGGREHLCTLQTAALECLAFRPDTRDLLVGGADGRIHVWEVPSRRLVREFDVAPRQVLSIEFSKNGAIMAAASGAGTLTLFDTASWTKVRSFTLPSSLDPVIYRAVLSPDGRLCIASLAYKDTDPNGIVERYEILVWHLEREDQPALHRTLVGHLGWIGGLAYAPERDLIASGSIDETVRIWDWQQHNVVAESRGHQGAVYGVAFSPDEKLLASCSADGAVQLCPISVLLQHTNLPNPLTEITIEAVLQRLLDAQRPGRSGLTLTARDIVERLADLRARTAIEREVNRLLPLLKEPAGPRLLTAILRTILIRLEQEYRAGNHDAAQFYHWLQLVIDAAATDYLEEGTLTLGAERRPSVATADSSQAPLNSAYSPSASLEPPTCTSRPGRHLLKIIAEAMQTSSSHSSLLEEAQTMSVSIDDVAAALKQLQAEARSAIEGRTNPQSVTAAAEILWVAAQRFRAPPLVFNSIASVLGIMSSLVGEHSRAVEHFEGAVEWARAANNSHSISAALGDLGNSYRNVGRLQDAQRAYRDALDLAESQGLVAHRINHLVNLSIVYADLGDTVAQGETLRKSRIEAKAIKSDRQLASIANQLGDLYNRVGDHQSALDSFREALSTGQRLKDERLSAAALGNISMSLAHLGRNPEAMQYISESISIAERIQEPGVVANGLIRMGRLQAEQGLQHEARQSLRRALEIARRMSSPTLLLSALTTRAQLAEDRWDDIGEATSSLEEAVKVGERLRHEIRRPEEGPKIQSRLAEIYTKLVRLNVRMGRAEQAFLASERGRAALLIRRLLERTGAIGRDAVDRVPDAHSFTIASLAAHLRQLGRNAVLVEYAFIADILYTFVLRADEGEIHCETLPIDPNRLSRLLSDFTREVIEYPRRGYLGETWLELGEFVVEPILQHLKESDILFLVPDGPLHGLPLHALRAGDRRVIERWPVAYLPSASALPSLTEASSRPPRRPFVLGIHFTDEAREVMGLLNTDRGIIGVAATKEAALEALAEADVIHISSYGFFSRREPARSGLLLQPLPELAAYLSAWEKRGFERTVNDLEQILFGNSANQSSILNATDIEILNLHSSLVTLSACESGLAAIDPGNDPVGLVSAFLASGATAVLASLWLVDPEVTRRLMTRLYGYLQSDTGWGRKPQALRRAMLDVMRTHPHPYYWAAFMLVGGAALSVVDHEEDSYA